MGRPKLKLSKWIAERESKRPLDINNHKTKNMVIFLEFLGDETASRRRDSDCEPGAKVFKEKWKQ